MGLVTYDKLTKEDDEQPASRFPDPEVYEFNIGDGLTCRANYGELESWYAQSFESYRFTEQENKKMY